MLELALGSMFLANVFQYISQAGACLCCSLTDPPAANETITTVVSLVNLAGNSIDVEPNIEYDKGVHTFTLQDYGQQKDTIIRTHGMGLLLSRQHWLVGPCMRCRRQATPVFCWLQVLIR